MQNFIQKNALQLLIILVSVVIAWTMIGSRILALETFAQESKQDFDKLTDLVERVIIIEERDKQLSEDVSEIKTDIREIKNRLNQL